MDVRQTRGLRLSSKRNQRGASLILLTFMCFCVVIPMVGLAIDGSLMFWIKGKLSSAVDASALAGARALSVTGTFANRQTVGTQTANQYFAANFPTGFLGTSVVGGTPSVSVTQTSSAVLSVSVQARVNAPLYFMRILGFNTVPIAASAISARRNVNILLVLDRSYSMVMNGSTACTTMRADAQTFTNYFTDGFDTLGLITFSNSANVDYAPTMYFKSSGTTLNSVINQLQCGGFTNSTHALNLAYATIKSINQTGALNVIVFFTDGQPDIVVSDNWPVKTQSDVRYGYNFPGWWPDYNTQIATGPSSCSSSLPPVSGAMSVLTYPPGTTGMSGGIFSYAPQPITQSGFPPVVNYAGCSFTANSGNYGFTVRNDIAYIPAVDKWGNSTTDGGYKPVDNFPSGNPYAGQIRADELIPGVMATAFNTADYQARIIRNDTNYNTIIYTIGLDGAPDFAIDKTFLMRVANDPNAGAAYDASRNAGQFAYAPSQSQLGAAFRQIASQILRLSQ